MSHNNVFCSVCVMAACLDISCHAKELCLQICAIMLMPSLWLQLFKSGVKYTDGGSQKSFTEVKPEAAPVSDAPPKVCLLRLKPISGAHKDTEEDCANLSIFKKRRSRLCWYSRHVCALKPVSVTVTESFALPSLTLQTDSNECNNKN